MKSLLLPTAIAISTLLFISCATTGGQVERTAADTTVDLSTKWNDTDARLVAEEMIADLLARPWLDEFQEAQGKKPVLIVGRIKNKSSEHIETATFIKDLEREIINSAKASFVASEQEREALRKEREEQQSQATEDTAKKLAAETGADYMLQGTITSILDESAGKKLIFYQVDLELIHIENNEKAWIGTKKIKKIFTNGR